MKTRLVLVAVAVALLAVERAEANSLTLFYQFNGMGNWSLDAVGSNSTPVGNVSAVVPAGSTVVKALLYSSNTPGVGGAQTITFDGTIITPAQFTPLGVNGGLEAYRADVTAQVAAKIGGGGAAPFTFSINSESNNSYVDGEALVVVYSNPAEVTRTIAILDGFCHMDGDVTIFNFASPVDPTVPGFEALMSLGIGYGYQDGYDTGQYSIVDVNGVRLTTSAGGQDDGIAANGGLITIGGIGDSILNPPNPYALPPGFSYDDELYNVASFITLGDTSFRVDTENPSSDDNIFFLGLNVTAEGHVYVVPEPMTAVACLMGLGALGGYLRRRRVA